MKILRALWFGFQMYRETHIKSRYFETEKGKAEKWRVYSERRWGHLK